MNKESKLNLNAGDYAIRHCVIDQTYDGLEVHKMLCDAYIAGNNDTLEDDDERIKNSLINLIKMSSEVGGFALHKWEADEMLAWLERQGEHANFRNKIQVGDKVTRNEAGVLVNLSQLNRVAKKNEKQGEQKFEMKSAAESLGVDSDTYNKIVDECIFGEQKPANKIEPKDYSSIDPHFGKPIDKVEPKFHEGEWITNGDYTWKIVEVKPLDYILQSQDGNIVDDTIYHVDEQFHSFTIADAKNGDVLVCNGNIKNSNGIKYERICLFNNLDNAFFILTKTSNFVEEYNIDVNIDYPDNTVPATKEQKEILFMAMKDAGYEFDFEKKELKIVDWSKHIKYNPNPPSIIKESAWSEEDEPQKELAESYLAKFDEKFPILPTLKGKQLADYKNFLNKCQQIFRLKYWGIRPIQAKLFEKLSLLWAAWGAEHLQGLGQTDGDMDDEILWSEEDEKMLDSICISINDESIAQGLRSRGDSYSIEDLTTICSKQINWLKSLKCRVQPKQKWSEEDEIYYKRVQLSIEWARAHNRISEGSCDEQLNWLKSLRHQNRWKPSDEQMGCLSDAIEHYNSLGYPAPKLKELLDDLKKLKEGKV